MKLHRSAFIFFVLLAFGLSVDAQSTVPAQPEENVQERVKQLEAQLEAMQAELKRLKETVSPSVQQNEGSKTHDPVNETRIIKTETPKTETKNEAKLQTESKKTGIDLGSIRLTPYGTIYFNAYSNGGATNNSDVPLFAVTSGQGNSSASARQTRLGLRLEGAKIGEARLSGVLEADFFGGFPAVGIGENFGVVRLRLANARLEWEKTSLTIGQDWMPFAPVNPTSLAAAAIPQMAAAGNNWARLPQIRIDHKLNDHLTWTGAVLAPQTGDYPTSSTFFLQPNSGAASRTPFFQTRIAFADKNLLGTKKPGTFGISAHYGRSRIVIGSTKNEIDSIGFAADWNLPLHKRISFTGEAFFGRNLAGFQAGVFQNYVPDFAYQRGNQVVPGGVRGIGTRGGWMQLGFTPSITNDRLTVFGSIGIDDPRDEDLNSVSRTNYRKQNTVFALNAIYKLSPQLSIGAEYRRFATLYFINGRRTAEHINLSGAFSF
jgi:hypothetical protein